MSQYKGYYTAGRGESQEADNRFGGRGESQEQDYTEYDNAGDGGTEYDNGDDTEYDPGGTPANAMFDSRQPSRSNFMDHGKRSHDEADLHNGRRVVDQVSFEVVTFVVSPNLSPGSATSEASENIQWGIQQVFKETDQCQKIDTKFDSMRLEAFLLFFVLHSTTFDTLIASKYPTPLQVFQLLLCT